MNILVAGDEACVRDREGREAVAKALDKLLASVTCPTLCVEAFGPLDSVCALYGRLMGIPTVYIPFDPVAGIKPLLDLCDKAVLFSNNSPGLKATFGWCMHYGIDTRVIGRDLDDFPRLDPGESEIDHGNDRRRESPLGAMVSTAGKCIEGDTNDVGVRPSADGTGTGRGKEGGAMVGNEVRRQAIRQRRTDHGALRSGHHDVSYTSHGERCRMTLCHREKRLTRDEAASYVAERFPWFEKVEVIG